MSSREESLETLRETHDFPCDYSMKVIGDNLEAFVAHVDQVGTNLTRDDVNPEFKTQESGEGTYISVTISFEIHEAETILDIYEGMNDIEGVRMVM